MSTLNKVCFKHVLVILCLIFSSFHPVFVVSSEKPISIETALDRNLINFQLLSEGGHQGDCALVTMESLIDQPLAVEIESGRNFVSLDTNKQDLINVEPLIFVLNDRQPQAKQMFSFCSQSHKSSPEKGDGYKLGDLTNEQTQQLCQYISKNKELYPLSAMQNAVWVLTNNRRVEGIYHQNRDSIQSLLDYVSGLTYTVTPWYGIEYAQAEDSLISDRAKTIYGNFEAKLKQGEEVKIVVYDMFNVDQIRKSINTTADGDSHPVMIDVSDLLPGRYRIGFYQLGVGRLDEKVFSI